MITAQDLKLRPPFPDESLDGFVADTAGANDLRKVKAISGAGGVTHGHRPNITTMGWRHLPALASMLEVKVEELELRSYPFVGAERSRRAYFGTTVHRGDLRTRERFFSPSALARSPHHRAMWQLRLPYDFETGELLVSTCPRTEWCGTVQRWRHSAGVRYCDVCVKDLSQQQVPTIAPDLRGEYMLAAGLTHTDPEVRATSLGQLPEPVASLGADMTFELLTRLIPVANSVCTWTSASRVWRNDPHEIAKGMAGAWHILKGWPDSLLARVQTDMSNGQKRHDDGNRGANRKFLTTEKAEGLPEPVRTLIDRFKETISLDGPNGAALKASTLTAVEVSAIIRIGTKELVELRRAGAFRTIVALRGTLLVPLFDCAEVLEVAAQIPGRLDLNSVNDRLGLPYYAVEQLAARGRLPSPSHPFFTHRYAGLQTTRAAFDDFLELLRQSRSDTVAGARPIASLMNMVGGGPKPWAVVVEAMLSGALPYTLDEDAPSPFDGIRVEPDVLRRLLGIGTNRVQLRCGPHDIGTSSQDKLLTKRDCAEILNVTERVAGMLLERYPASGNPVVPLTDIELLARAHVTPTELAARLDTTRDMVKEVARRLGIRRLSKAGYHVGQDARLVAALSAPATVNLSLPFL